MRPGVIHLRSSAGMYGAEHVLLGLAGEQTRRGVATRLIGFAPTGRERPALLASAAARGIDSQPLPCNGPFDPSAVMRLRRLLRTCGPGDVLHCHDYKSVVYATLAAAQLPIVRIATLHGWVECDARLRLYRWLELRALRGFDRVCAVSPRIEQDLLDAGIDPAAVRRVDNGIDTERFRPQPQSLDRSLDASAVRLGCAARLSPEKNLGQLIHAVAECRARGRLINLCIHGDGPLRSELERLVARLGLRDCVQLPGAAGGLEHWYPSLDAFVLPSLSEGMPMTVLEAMACGCPVVASAVGALPELLSGLAGGSLVNPGDQDALVDALMAVPRRRGPHRALRQRVVAGYSVARMTDQYGAVYDDALARGDVLRSAHRQRTASTASAGRTDTPRRVRAVPALAEPRQAMRADALRRPQA